MKIINLTNGLVATLLLASPIVGAETEYPAADFKPKVIYQDTASTQAKSASSAVAQKQNKSEESDSRYPAADFEPKVLYKDTDYKPSKFTASASSDSAMTSNEELTSPEKANDESMMTYLLGLGIFGGVGYFFLSKRDKKSAINRPQEFTKHVSGLSGVARYLRKHNMGAVTGVARYLENQVSTAKSSAKASGVEKYLEKQAKSAKEKAAQAGTGVEKYMRNRG